MCARVVCLARRRDAARALKRDARFKGLAVLNHHDRVIPLKTPPHTHTHTQSHDDSEQTKGSSIHTHTPRSGSDRLSSVLIVAFDLKRLQKSAGFGTRYI